MTSVTLGIALLAGTSTLFLRSLILPQSFRRATDNAKTL